MINLALYYDITLPSSFSTLFLNQASCHTDVIEFEHDAMCNNNLNLEHFFSGKIGLNSLESGGCEHWAEHPLAESPFSWPWIPERRLRSCR